MVCRFQLYFSRRFKKCKSNKQLFYTFSICQPKAWFLFNDNDTIGRRSSDRLSTIYVFGFKKKKASGRATVAR